VVVEEGARELRARGQVGIVVYSGSPCFEQVSPSFPQMVREYDQLLLGQQVWSRFFVASLV
jgi:hypothetical protein